MSVRLPWHKVATILCAVFFFGTFFSLLPGELSRPASETFSNDSAGYHRGAVHMLHDGFFSEDGVHADTEHEPGYSFFLAGIYTVFGEGNRVAIFMVQAILYFFASLVFARALGTVTSKRTEVICLVLLCLSPALYRASFMVYREAFVLSLMLLTLSCCIRWVLKGEWASMLGASILLSSIILTYFSFVLLPIVLVVPLFFLRKKNRVQLLLLLLVPTIAVTTLAHRNSQYSGGDVCTLPGCTRGAFAWYTRGEQLTTLTGLKPFECIYAEYVTLKPREVSQYCQLGDILNRGWPQGFRGHEKEIQDAAAIAREQIPSHLLTYATTTAAYMVEYQLPNLGGWRSFYNILETLFTAIVHLGVLLYIIRRRYQWSDLLFVLPMLYATSIFALVDVIPRYRLPVLGCYIALAAMGYAGRKIRSAHA